jgi:hypothetical protein
MDIRMKQISHRIEAASRYDDIKVGADFTINKLLASEINSLAALLTITATSKIEKQCHCVIFHNLCPSSAGQIEPAQIIVTENQMINVTASEYWFSGTRKSDGVELLTSRQSVDFLRKQFSHLLPEAISSVRVKHWDCYGVDSVANANLELAVFDKRTGAGQLHVEFHERLSQDNLLLGVTAEINDSPIDGHANVPCFHVHLNYDTLGLSVYKIGRKILVVPERSLTFEKTKVLTHGTSEIAYWLS